MKIKNTLLFVVPIICVLLITSSGAYGDEHRQKINEEEYSKFINLFMPSENMAFIFNITPEKIVAHIGNKNTIHFQMVKINDSVREDFYLKFIISSDSWEISEYYTSEQGFMDKIEEFNKWLNNAWPLTNNVYSDNFTVLHFTPDMMELSHTFHFTFYTSMKMYILVLARPANGTLWVPVGGYGNIKIMHDSSIMDFMPYLYPLTMISVVGYITWRMRMNIYF